MSTGGGARCAAWGKRRGQAEAARRDESWHVNVPQCSRRIQPVATEPNSVECREGSEACMIQAGSQVVCGGECLLVSIRLLVKKGGSAVLAVVGRAR